MGKNLVRDVLVEMKIETERLILRNPMKKDWKEVCEGLNNMNIARGTLRIPFPYSKKDAEGFLRKVIKSFGKTDYTFYIILKEEGKLIGSICITKLDKYQGTAETASWINEKYQRKGYITEAKIAVNDFAFNKLKLRRLGSSVFTDNVASNKTQLGMGYKFEGTARKFSKSLSTGKIHDLNIYGLLNEDWKKARSSVIRNLNKKIKKLEKKSDSKN